MAERRGCEPSAANAYSSWDMGAPAGKGLQQQLLQGSYNILGLGPSWDGIFEK